MGISRVRQHTKHMSKTERDKYISEYKEARDRLIIAQQPPQPKKTRKKAERKNGKVTTYHISELEGKNNDK